MYLYFKLSTKRKRGRRHRLGRKLSSLGINNYHQQTVLFDGVGDEERARFC